MLEHYEIDSIEQLRAVADVLRMHILNVLTDQPMTVTQLGEALGQAPAKMHYHVRELEKVGLLRLVETREKGGILEKYYQPVAKDFTVSNSLFLRANPDESLATVGAFFDQLRDDFQRAFRLAIEKKDEHFGFALDSKLLYLTLEEHAELSKKIFELFKQYEQPRGIEGEQATLGALVMHPRLENTGSATTQATDNAARATWTVGAVRYSRADLEKVLAEGQRLSIHVTGICQFAKDVSAELAEQAIEQVQVIGKIEASAAVRAVLERKRG